MTEWPRLRDLVDGLDPPGEQLGLFDVDPHRAEVVEVIVHRVVWGVRSWSCSCGAGREWPTTAPAGRPMGAARVHMRGVRRRTGM